MRFLLDSSTNTAIPCQCQQSQLDDQMRQFLRRDSGVPEFHQKDGFEGFDIRHPSNALMCRVAREYATSGQLRAEKPWLVLVGPSGCGKTHMAYAITNTLVYNRLEVRYYYVRSMLTELLAGHENGTYYTAFVNLKNHAHLILDDIAIENLSPAKEDILIELLDHRYREHLRTVVISNANLNDLSPVLASRLKDKGLSQVVTNTAPDYRLLNRK